MNVWIFDKNSLDKEQQSLGSHLFRFQTFVRLDLLQIVSNWRRRSVSLTSIHTRCWVLQVALSESLLFFSLNNPEVTCSWIYSLTSGMSWIWMSGWSGKLVTAQEHIPNVRTTPPPPAKCHLLTLVFITVLKWRAHGSAVSVSSLCLAQSSVSHLKWRKFKIIVAMRLLLLLLFLSFQPLDVITGTLTPALSFRPLLIPHFKCAVAGGHHW